MDEIKNLESEIAYCTRAHFAYWKGKQYKASIQMVVLRSKLINRLNKILKKGCKDGANDSELGGSASD